MRLGEVNVKRAHAWPHAIQEWDTWVFKCWQDVLAGVWCWRGACSYVVVFVIELGDAHWVMGDALQGGVLASSYRARRPRRVAPPWWR